MTAPPPGYVQIAGLNVPDDVAPTLLEAIRAIYATQTAGLSDEDAVATVTWALMADLLTRYAVWSTTRDTQQAIATAQAAAAAAQTAAQQQITHAQLAAGAAAARIITSFSAVALADTTAGTDGVASAGDIPLTDTTTSADALAAADTTGP